MMGLRFSWTPRTVAVTIVALCALLASVLFVNNPDNAHAVPLSNGGNLEYRVTGWSPTAADTQLCANARKRPNFTVYFDNAAPPYLTVHTDGNPTEITFAFSVAWRDCSEPTDGYALFSGKFCPTSGFYGGDTTADRGYEVNDCVKYVYQNPRNNSDVNPALGCPYYGKSLKNPSQDCTSSAARALQQFLVNGSTSSRAGPKSQTPSSVGQELRIPFTTDLGKPNPSMSTRSSGSNSFEGQMCQYFWYANESAAQSQNDVCRDMVINYEWTYTPPPPSYSLKANITDLGGIFSYFQNMPSGWNFGATVESAANLVPDIGSHNLDLFRLTFDGNPPGWGEGTMTTGDNGLCDAVTGEASCTRVEALTCPRADFCPASLNSAGQSWGIGYSGESGPHDAGKNVCFISRVSMPNQSSNQNEWKTSKMVCAKSVKKPRVQFTGSDVRVGGVIESSPYSVRGNYYGSWGEYGVLSGGGNNLVGSGNAFRTPNGLNGTELTKLTFRNDDQSSIGYYKNIKQSDAFNYFRGLATTASANTPPIATGVYNYTPGTLGRLNAINGGSSIIIKHSGTLLITDDITVPNNGVTSANALSQVVIVADNIEIAPGVGQIDAWLLADPNGGFINTCSDLTPLTTGVCNKFLQVNGPILTDRLYLRRTAGANLPEANIKDPAEKFNLRPDAQLWAYSYANKADFAQTDYVQELPPRY